MATATRRVVRTMPQMFIDVTDNQSERLQVAAYARVSTEKEEQEDSFERQVEHYKQLIYSCLCGSRHQRDASRKKAGLPPHD